MLKIKDNVNLKELEKFGFKIHSDLDWYCYNIDKRADLFVKPLNRKIIFKVYNDNNRYMNNVSILYYLIKADLVEVVDE